MISLLTCQTVGLLTMILDAYPYIKYALVSIKQMPLAGLNSTLFLLGHTQ